MRPSGLPSGRIGLRLDVPSRIDGGLMRQGRLNTARQIGEAGALGTSAARMRAPFPSRPVRAPFAARPVRVLVVDEDQLFRARLRQLLADDGLSVVGDAA